MTRKKTMAGHTKSAFDESAAVRILASKLEEKNQIKTFFKENDRTPNNDGIFELAAHDGEPVKQFIVQIKKVENLRAEMKGKNAGKYVYRLDTAFLNYVRKKVVENPAVYFVVDICTKRIFYLYLSDACLDSLDFEGKSAVTCAFSENNIIKDIDCFYESMVRISEERNHGIRSESGIVKRLSGNGTENLGRRLDASDCGAEHLEPVPDYETVRKLLRIQIEHIGHELFSDVNEDVSEEILPEAGLACSFDAAAGSELSPESDRAGHREASASSGMKVVSCTYDNLMDYLEQQNLSVVQLLGEGGMGKTSFLMKLGMLLNGQEKTAAFFVRLHDVNGMAPEEAQSFLEDNLAQQIRPCSSLSLTEEFLCTKAGRPKYILLLDGFNEIQKTYKGIIARQIKQFAHYENVRVIVTSREKITGAYGLYKIAEMHMEKLRDEQIDAYLKAQGIDIEKTEPFRELLSIPMMLTVYSETNKEKKYHQDMDYFTFYEECHTKAELISNYMESLAAKYYMENVDADDAEKHLVLALYVGHFILPGIGFYMEREGVFSAESTEVFSCIEQLLKNSEISFIRRWFGQRGILETDFVEALDAAEIMEYLKAFPTVFSRQRKWRFTHQNFRDVLAAGFCLMECEQSCLQKKISPTLTQVWSEEIHVCVGELLGEYDVSRKRSTDDVLHRVADVLRFRPGDEIRIPLYNVLQVWKLARKNLAGEDFHGLDLKGQILEPYIHGDGKTVTDFTDAVIYPENLLPAGHEGVVSRVCYSGDGAFIATAGDDGAVCLWDAKTGQLIWKESMGRISFISGLDFSADFRYLAVSSFEAAFIWNVGNRTLEHVFDDGHGDIVSGISWNPVRAELASAGHDGCVCIWDVRSGRQRLCLEAGDLKAQGVLETKDVPEADLCPENDGIPEGYVWESAELCSYSPDGERIAAGFTYGGVELWDSRSGAVLAAWHAHDGRVLDIKWNKCGRMCTAGEDGTAAVWEIRDGKVLQLHRLLGHGKGIFEMAISPDETVIATASMDHTARLWCLESGECLHVLEGHGDFVQRVRFQPQGRCLATSACDGTVGIWDAATGQRLHMLRGHTDIVGAIAFSTDGNFLATASVDENVYIYHVKTGRAVHWLKNNGKRIQDAWMTSDRKLLTQDYPEHTARIWEPDTKRCLWERKNISWKFCFSPDGRQALEFAEHRVEMWDTGDNKCLWALPWENEIRDFVYAPDGKVFVIVDENETAFVVEASSGHRIVVLAGNVVQVLFSPDGKYMAGWSKREIYVWQRDNWELAAEYIGTGKYCPSVYFTPDGRHLAVVWWSGYTFINFRRDIVTDAEKVSGDIERFDRDIFAETVTGDGCVQFWNYDTGKIIRQIEIPNGQIKSMVHNKIHGVAAALLENGEILIWSAEDGKYVRRFLNNENEIWKIRFSADGRTLLGFYGTIVYGLDWQEQRWETLIDQRYEERLMGCRLEGAIFDEAMRPEDMDLLKMY